MLAAVGCVVAQVAMAKTDDLFALQRGLEVGPAVRGYWSDSSSTCYQISPSDCWPDWRPTAWCRALPAIDAQSEDPITDDG